jgi:hypothetical protein
VIRIFIVEGGRNQQADLMIITNSWKGIDIVVVVDARNDESLVRFLKSRSVRAGIACKHAALVSDRLFENFDGVTATACASKHHIHEKGLKIRGDRHSIRASAA